MEHWSEACWSEAWGFGPRHGPFGPRHGPFGPRHGPFGPRLGVEMAHGVRYRLISSDSDFYGFKSYLEWFRHFLGYQSG